jgi:hypothetical protein
MRRFLKRPAASSVYLTVLWIERWMCVWTLKGILASIPARSTIFCRPDTVNSALRSLTKMNGDLASRFSARSARSSSRLTTDASRLTRPWPYAGAVCRFRTPRRSTATRTILTPVGHAGSRPRSWHCLWRCGGYPSRPRSASRPHARSGGSRGRSALFGRRVGVTVRFIVAGATSLRCALAM